MTDNSFLYYSMSHLNVPSGFLKGDAHMEHRGTAVVGEPPLLIDPQAVEAEYANLITTPLGLPLFCILKL